MRKFQLKTKNVVAVAILLTLVSCYKFGRIAAPKTVAAFESFEGRIVVANDNNNGPVTGYSIFAVRVPENWDVTTSDNAYVQYATGDITIPGDENDPTKPAEKANISDVMHYSSLLSSMYNTSNPKEGYTWVAFITDNKHRRGIQGHQSNSCDSIAFNYTVTNDGIAGDYELDYIIADEEDNIEKYIGKLNDALGTRVFCTSTEAAVIKKADGGDVWDHVQPEFKTIVTVLEGEGEPTVHKPSTAVSSPTIGTDDAITIEYSNIAPDTRLAVFKYADRLPLNKDYIVEGLERFNNGSYELSGFEPGEYHVRGIDPNGNIIANMQEATFSVSYPEFEAGDASLMIVSDVHLMAPELLVNEGEAMDKYRNGDSKLYKESPELLQAAIDRALNVKPTALLISGDLTKDGELKSHQLMASMLKQLTDAGIKVYVVPGDHDINNPNASIYDGDQTMRAESINANQFAEIYADCGYTEAVSRDEASLSYMVYPTEGLAIICIDGCRYNENVIDGEEPSEQDVLVSEGRITKETLQWIATASEEARATGRNIVAMMHHLISDPFNGYGTLGSVVNGQPVDIASQFTGEEPTEEPYEVTTADVQQAFADAQIKIVFTGDLQATDIQRVSIDEDIELYQVTTGALTAFDCPYRLINIDEDKMEIDTRVIKEADVEIPSDMTLEDYAYYRFNNNTPELVKGICNDYWPIINGIFQENFVFPYDPDTDPFNKNDFMRLPESAEDVANRVNNNITQPILNVIASFVEGNEHLKDSQKMVDDVKAGFDGFFNTLNTLPDIITPMIKEGFADAGLDTDAIADTVVGSLAFNYLGETGNVINDLFCTIALGNETAIHAPVASTNPAIKVKVNGRVATISYEGMTSDRLQVYSSVGAQLANVHIQRGTGSQRIILPQEGIYMLRIGNSTVKVSTK